MADPEGDGPFPFKPDWVIAPGVILAEWLEETGLKPAELAFVCGGKDRHGAALALIMETLDRKPLRQAHAACLHRGTGVTVRFWEALEHDYRAGLAAGLTDASDT